MIVNSKTKEGLAHRRFARAMSHEGYEVISENGNPLWQLTRGFRTHEKIIDAKVDPTGRAVYIKTTSA